MIWRTALREISLGDKPLVMGILNLTPDSFSDGGQLATVESAVRTAQEMEQHGADILDVGAESTRPGATPVELEAEWQRLEPVLQALAGRISLPLSIDTYKPEIARRAAHYGAEIINDVSGGQWVEGMWKIVLDHQFGYVLTHSQGPPTTMQHHPHYWDVLPEIIQYLQRKIADGLAAGIHPTQMVIDPGLGFGKTIDHNLTILARLAELQILQRPILVGVSRKSFLKKIAGEEALAVSTVTAQVWAAAHGARIWRVHDVSAAVAAAKIVEQLQRCKVVKP
jgi:dihydropteroate synthase